MSAILLLVVRTLFLEQVWILSQESTVFVITYLLALVRCSSFAKSLTPPGKRVQSRALQASVHHSSPFAYYPTRAASEDGTLGAVLLFTGGLHNKPTAVTTWSARIAKFHQPCLGQLACSPTRMQSRGLESVPLCSTMPRSPQFLLAIVNLFFSSRAAPAFRMFACALERRH